MIRGANSIAKTAVQVQQIRVSSTKDNKRVLSLSNQPMENQGSGNKNKKSKKENRETRQKGIGCTSKACANKKVRKVNKKQQLTGALLLQIKTLVLEQLRGIQRYFPSPMYVATISAKMRKNKTLIMSKLSNAQKSKNTHSKPGTMTNMDNIPCGNNTPVKNPHKNQV